jgi:hypothetical protein
MYAAALGSTPEAAQNNGQDDFAVPLKGEVWMYSTGRKSFKG